MTLERAGERFSRAMRLTRGRDIARVFRGGLSVSNPYVTIRAHRRGGTSAARLAFAIARRHVASAVRRNRVKRIVRESFRRHAGVLCGHDIVVISRSGLSGAGDRELRVAVDRQWSRLLAEPVRGVRGRRPDWRQPKAPPADNTPVRPGAKNVPPVE